MSAALAAALPLTRPADDDAALFGAQLDAEMETLSPAADLLAGVRWPDRFRLTEDWIGGRRRLAVRYRIELASALNSEEQALADFAVVAEVAGYHTTVYRARGGHVLYVEPQPPRDEAEHPIGCGCPECRPDLHDEREHEDDRAPVAISMRGAW